VAHNVSCVVFVLIYPTACARPGGFNWKGCAQEPGATSTIASVVRGLPEMIWRWQWWKHQLPTKCMWCAHDANDPCVFLMAPPSRKLICVENHAPNVGGQVHGGESYKQVGNNYKNSYYIYQNKTIIKCGIDMPSKPNSEIPTWITLKTMKRSS